MVSSAHWLALATLIIGVPLNVLATVLLFKKYRQAPTLRVLRERFIVAAITTVLVLVFGLIFMNNDVLPVPPLDLDATKLITRAMILLMAVIPAVSWIYLYFVTGRKSEMRRMYLSKKSRRNPNA